MKKPKSPAQQFHYIREFQSLGSLAGILTRLEQIAREPTTLSGESIILGDAAHNVRLVLSGWKDNSPRAKEHYMKGQK
jgi:hypothetical protein